MKQKKIIAVLAIILLTANAAFAQNIPIPSYKPVSRVNIVKMSEALKYIKNSAQNKDSTSRQKDYLVEQLNFLNITVAPTYRFDSVIEIANQLASDYNNTSTFISTKTLLRNLRDTIKSTPFYDTAALINLNNRIGNIKIYGIYEFLAVDKRSVPFSVFRLRQYNIDTFNTWLYNQNDVDVFQNASIQNFASTKTFISTELASFLFGPVRMGVGGAFTTKGDTTKDAAIKTSLQKMLTSGGSLNLNFLMPVFLTRTRHDQVHAGLYLMNNNSINPGIDSSGKTDISKDVWYTSQSGIIFHADFGSNDRKAAISFDFPFYYSWGSNNSYQQLGIRDFGLLKMQVGAVIRDLINLHVSGPLWSSSKTVQKTPFSISLQFSPSQVAKSVQK